MKKQLVEKRRIAEEKRIKELQMMETMKSMRGKLEVQMAEQLFKVQMMKLDVNAKSSKNAKKDKNLSPDVKEIDRQHQKAELRK
jgi:hypothetical protein